MTKFSGFDGWISIFRGGKQTDSSGVEHDGDALIEKAVANFNAATHEPPIVIGHPREDAPAWGWVEGLKKVGNELLMKCRQVHPEFASMVERGQFKKRSAAFYPDGSLRHVGFLGAMPPAVKGLPDMAFAEGEFSSFEFSESYAWQSLADIFRRLREWIIETKDQDTADRIIPDWKIDDMRAAGNPPAEQPTQLYTEKEDQNMNFKEKLAKFFAEFLAKMPDDGPAATPAPAPAGQPDGRAQFSEADLEKAKTDAAKAEREKVMAEFAETQRQTKLATLKTEIAAFCDGLSKAGKITPATIAFGLPEILFALAANDNQIEFGETKAKATAFDRMKALLDSAKPLVTFGEVATRDRDTGGQGAAGEKLDKITRDKMQINKALTYSAAFAEAQKENPELVQEYEAQVRGE